MAQFVTRAFIEKDGTRLDAEEIGYELTIDGKDRVKTMHASNFAQGHSGGVKMADITATIAQRFGAPVDLRQVWLNEEDFTTVVEEEDGRVLTFAECRLSSVRVAARSGDKLTLDVTIEALRVAIDAP